MIGLHHHHYGDLEMYEHFDIDNSDPMDLIEDTIVVHDHDESHSDFGEKSLCGESDCLVEASARVSK